MGYTTTFSGGINLSRKLTFKEAKEWLDICEMESREISEKYGGAAPNSYFQWLPSESLDTIVWDGNEKFYEYTDWLQWIVDHLSVKKITASGRILFQGEDIDDRGYLIVEDRIASVSRMSDKAPHPMKPLTRDRLSEMILETV